MISMATRGTQIINGIEYVYEYTTTWNPEKKRAEHKRNYISKNVNGEFVPHKKYQLQLELESSKNQVKPGPVPVIQCKRLFYGATYLFDAIGEKIGVTQDLKSYFPEDYKDILSLAYFLILEESPLYAFINGL